MVEITTGFLVLLTSVSVSLLTEFLSWLLVYRTSNYRRVRDNLDRNSERYEQYKAQNKTPGDKKEKKLEESVKSSAREFQAVKAKTNMLTAAVNLLVLNRLMAFFEGVPVARLPFQPFGWFATMVSHRGLPGNDLYECGALFLYIMCTTFCKVNLTQGAPWNPSRAAERALRPQPAAQTDS